MTWGGVPAPPYRSGVLQIGAPQGGGGGEFISSMSSSTAASPHIPSIRKMYIGRRKSKLTNKT